MTLFVLAPGGGGVSLRALRVVFGAAAILGAALAFWDVRAHHVWEFKAELRRIEERTAEIRATYPP